MDTALGAHRFHFAFSVTYHYLFPQLTMGLGLLLVVLETAAIRTGKPVYRDAARLWSRIFAIAFGMGVITGVPLSFQIGANWSRFAEFGGGIAGHLLAMEGVFAFFLESSFLGLYLYGQKRQSPRLRWIACLMVCLGSWMSGFFIVAVNAWMQHPYEGSWLMVDGVVRLKSVGALFTNPWFLPQYAHTMVGSVVTGSFAMAGVGAWYVLRGRHVAVGKVSLRLGVVAALFASIAAAMPTGDLQAKNVVKHQPETFAAMEGIFHTEKGAGIALVGQPDVENLRLDNPIIVPNVLSFLTYQRFDAEVKGLTDFPRDRWPDNIPLLYYSYHIMAGLGSLFIGLASWCAFRMFRKRLETCRLTLWALMLAVPFPFIANTAGWMTAELGRQPWTVYGLLRTQDAYSANVSAGNAMFTLLGYMGLYTVLSFLFVLLVGIELRRGPGGDDAAAPDAEAGG